MAPSPLHGQQEVENLVAFARLYGVARYFYPGDAALSLDWNRFAVHGVQRVREARDPADLQARLRELFTPLGPGIEIAAKLPPAPPRGAEDASLVSWRYIGAGLSTMRSVYAAMRTNRDNAPQTRARIPDPPIAGSALDLRLARGLNARVALALTDSQAKTPPQTLASLRLALSRGAEPTGSDWVGVQVADVIVAWNVLRHFYPYWTDIGVDWDGRLAPHIVAALAAPNRRVEHRDVIRRLVADIRDGHGRVIDVTSQQNGVIPILFRVIQGQLAVVAVDSSSGIPIGSVVTTIDGVDATERMRKEAALVSGSPQWAEWTAAQQLGVCNRGSKVRLILRAPDGKQLDRTLDCGAMHPMREARPDSVAELEPGIWYVDLSRVQAAPLQPALPQLARARGIVFDVRGYPTDAGYALLPYLVDSVHDDDRWMHVSKLVGPFGESSGWESHAWRIARATPHLGARRVFLTDGRAISYAESVMGHIKDHELGTILGSPTAGANGNVATCTVPGGFRVAFTGMRVTRHDGSTPIHVVGIQPDIALQPTLAGVQAGRDELLERALSILRSPSRP